MSLPSNQLGVPSSAYFVCAHGSTLEDWMIVDEDYFSLIERHKFMDFVAKYKTIAEKKKAIDQIVEHKGCKICVKLLCIHCFRFVLYDKKDFLEPYCYHCEKFFHI